MRRLPFIVASVLALLGFVPGSASTAYGQTAAYVSTDTTTGASHSGYGADGSVIALTSSKPPSYASYTVVNDSTWTWQSGVFGGQCWYNTSFSIDVTVTGTHQIALYTIDWDSQGRRETITVNGSAPQIISSFTKGAYIIYNVTGSVVFTITANSGPNAVVSAVFFDSPGGTTAVVPPPPPPATSHKVTLSWTSVAGATGYNVYRSTPPGAFTKINTTAIIAPSYTDSTVVAGGTYSYAVTTLNTVGESPQAPVTAFVIPSP